MNGVAMTCGAQTVTDTIYRIRHGSSFGECYGYCLNETSYDIHNIITTKTNYGKESEINYPDKSDTIKNSAANWKAFINSVNLNAFYKLSNTIGCPDCTDGGAEWIEIISSTNTYKVTFEYRAKIEALNPLLLLVRNP